MYPSIYVRETGSSMPLAPYWSFGRLSLVYCVQLGRGTASNPPYLRLLLYFEGRDSYLSDVPERIQNIL